MEIKVRRKDKENVVADALSRIKINALTIKQNKISYEEHDDDLLSELAEVDSDDELAPDDADAILNGEPIQEKELEEDTYDGHCRRPDLFSENISQKY